MSRIVELPATPADRLLKLQNLLAEYAGLFPAQEDRQLELDFRPPSPPRPTFAEMMASAERRGRRKR